MTSCVKIHGLIMYGTYKYVIKFDLHVCAVSDSLDHSVTNMAVIHHPMYVNLWFIYRRLDVYVWFSLWFTYVQ